MRVPTETRVFARVALCAVVLGAVPACVPGVRAARDTMTDPGQLMFNAYAEPKVGCYRCHNGDARGTRWGPDLVTEVRSLSDDAFQEIVATGRPGMPGHKDKLTREHVASMLSWLRALSGSPAP